MSTTSKPLISIAMCTYNGEHYLREQLDSLIKQDYPNLEIIIRDDQSKDSTVSILAEYAQGHPHIQWVQNQEHLGFVRNFEQCLRRCKGSFIALCDQDDIWFPRKISKLYENIATADLIYSAVQLMDRDGRELDQVFPKCNRLSGRVYLGLLLANCVTGHACLIRKELLKKALPIPTGIKAHDHWIAIIAASQKGIIAHPEALSLYRAHGANTLLGNKAKNTERTWKKRKGKFLKRLHFIKAFKEIADLQDPLLDQIIEAYQKHTGFFKNRHLDKLIESNEGTVLELHIDKAKARRKLCRGFVTP